MNEKYRPSSGTAGEIFMQEWCYQCEHEYQSPDEYCQIANDTFVFSVDEPGYPKEWVYDEERKPKCTAFNCSEKCRKEYRCDKTIDLFKDR